MNKKKMVVAGAYGCGNTGDDAILAGLLKKYPSDKWDITAFSADPEQTERYFCVKTVKQKLNMGFSLGLLREFEFVKMIKAIKDADILLIGGGALIHDLRIYNLPYFFLLHALARVFCKKVIYFGIGVGPLSTRFGKWLCRHMFPKANHVSVRDQEGKIWLEKAGVKTEIFVSADPAFSLSDEDVDPVEVQNVFLVENIPKSFIGTTVCGWFKSEDFWKRHHVDLTRPLYRMIEIYEHIIEKHQKEILFIPTVIPYDRELAKQIKVCIKYPQHFHYLKYDYKPTVLMGIIGRSQWMLAMRLHSMIFATIMNIPFFAIVYDQKVSNFLKITKNKYYCDMNDLDSNVIFSRLNTFVNKQDLMKDSLRGIYNRLYHILERFNYDEI